MTKVCETIEVSPAIDTFYECKIENFPQLYQFNRKVGLESSQFDILAADDKKVSVKLVISPVSSYGYDVRVQELTNILLDKGVLKTSKHYVILEVKVRAVDGKTNLNLEGTLELLTDDGTTFSGKLGDNEGHCFWPIRNRSSVELFYSSSWRPIQNAFCVPRASQSLQLKAHLTTPGSLSSTTRIIPVASKSKESLTKLSSDFKALLTNANDSADFKIVCEDQIFPCHEAILRARSPVLDKMFQQKMKESIEKRLIINDMKKATVGIFLEYLYAGEVPSDVENLSELIYSADKYQIAELLELCYNKIPDDDEKIVDILLIANRHNLVELSKVVMQRFVASNLPEVDVKILDILTIAEEHKLEEFKKVVLQKIMMKKAMFMKNEEFMSKLKESPSILIEFFKL